MQAQWAITYKTETGGLEPCGSAFWVAACRSRARRVKTVPPSTGAFRVAGAFSRHPECILKSCILWDTI
jgi:hypothetical protein